MAPRRLCGLCLFVSWLEFAFWPVFPVVPSRPGQRLPCWLEGSRAVAGGKAGAGGERTKQPGLVGTDKGKKARAASRVRLRASPGLQAARR